MTNDELNEKIRQACTHAAPDVLDAVLSDCNGQFEWQVWLPVCA